MKKTINFNKGFLPSVIISCLIIICGIAGFFVKGINLGLDFKSGLIEEVRIANPAAELSYAGSAKVAVEFSDTKMDLIISGIGAVNETKTFNFYEYETVGKLADAVNAVEDVKMVVRDAEVSSSELFLDSTATNQLTEKAIFVYPFGKSVASIDDIRASLSDLQGISVKQLGQQTDPSFQIRMGVTGDETQNDLTSKVNAALRNSFGDDALAIIKTDFIGSSYSKSIMIKSIIMFAFTVLLIWGYAAIRFHWDFALGSVIALIHDTLIMFTFIVWTQMEFSTTVLAAVLTIVGYSINATVVILDRVRYNVKMMKDVTTFKEILNQSLSDTLTRSILTTVTTLVAVLSLFIFTTGSIKDFSLAMIIGLISGMYSSIFISSAFIGACRKNWKPEFGIHHSLKYVKADEE